MLNQEPQAGNPQSAEGQGSFEPTVIPMEDPAAAVTHMITPDSPNAGGSAQGQGATQAKTESEEVAYWKRVAQDNRDKAERFAEYSVIINHLEQNPEHVEVLTKGVEGHTIGIIAAENMVQHAQAQRQPSQEELLAAELGVESTPMNEGRPAPQAPSQGYQPSREELIRLGEEQARAKLEFQQFREDMASKGVPDHAIDEYIQVLRKPDGLNHYDLFVAVQNYKNRTKGTEGEGTVNPGQGQPQNQPPVGAPISVTSMPAGQTDRPESNAYVGEVDGMKFVQNPQDI